MSTDRSNISTVQALAEQVLDCLMNDTHYGFLQVVDATGRERAGIPEHYRIGSGTADGRSSIGEEDPRYQLYYSSCTEVWAQILGRAIQELTTSSIIDPRDNN